MTQALLKACTAKVRRAAVEDCGGTLVMVKDRGLTCENKSIHLLPFQTGFCHSGWHEGHKIDKPTCKFWITCPCDCHTLLSRMAALTETERMLADNSTWVPDRTGLVQVSRTDLAVQAAKADPDIRVIASDMPSVMPDRFERNFAATGSGRAARGQLEMQVDEAVRAWITDREGNCTPPWVSDKIKELYDMNRGPSTGAIDAVFKRWASIGYAMIGQKPTRFISFTPDGIQLGLVVLKARAKH